VFPTYHPLPREVRAAADRRRTARHVVEQEATTSETMPSAG
jgi:hypothetical protein